MNATIEKARELRENDETPSPSALYKLAKDDAQAILDWIRDHGPLLAMADAVKELYRHLTRDELAACIYRHAMIEAGAVIEARTRKPYDICPVCAHDFTVPL
jgi:hypothetical protein